MSGCDLASGVRSGMGFLGRLEVVETRFTGVVGTDKGDIRVNTCLFFSDVARLVSILVCRYHCRGEGRALWE